MAKSLNLSVYHDTRRKKANGLYPVKIQVYLRTTEGRKQQRFFKLSSPLSSEAGHSDLSKEEFEKSYMVKNPRGRFAELKRNLIKEEEKARKVAEGLDFFNFTEFERRYYSDYSSGLEGAFQDYIHKLNAADRLKTAQGYEHSLRKLQEFVKHEKLSAKDFNFSLITPDFLHRFERWMLEEGRSLNTVSIYLRYLRYIFNQAIDKGIITKAQYPFGKSESKFTIAATKNVKRALEEEEIKALYHVETQNDFELRAKQYWFLSYSLNGINLKDLAELKVENYDGEVIEFFRAKTSHSTRENREKIVLQVSDFSSHLIEQIQATGAKESDYLLPIYTDRMKAREKEATRRDLIKNINYNLAKLSKRAGLDCKVTTYYARHSYTTVALNNGTSLEMLRETLGHRDLKTTMNYVGSFKKSKLRDLSNQVTSFLE